MTDTTRRSNSAAPPPRGPLARVALWALVLAWAGVIFWWSSKPGTQIPGRFSEIGHFGEYCIFGVLLYFALRRDLPRHDALALAIVIASCYGATDEFHQHFVYLRTPDVTDWGMDTVGAMVGSLLAWIANRRFARG